MKTASDRFSTAEEGSVVSGCHDLALIVGLLAIAQHCLQFVIGATDWSEPGSHVLFAVSRCAVALL